MATNQGEDAKGRELRERVIASLQKVRKGLTAVLAATEVGPNPFGRDTSELERKRNELIQELLAMQQALLEALALLDDWPQLKPEERPPALLRWRAICDKFRRHRERAGTLWSDVATLCAKFKHEEAQMQGNQLVTRPVTPVDNSSSDENGEKFFTGAAGAGVGAWIGSHIGIALLGTAVSGVVPVAALGIWGALKLRDMLQDSPTGGKKET